MKTAVAPFDGGLITQPIDFADMVSYAVGNAAQARLRYNNTSGTLQVSYAGAAYVDLATSASATLQGAYTNGGLNGGLVTLSAAGGPLYLLNPNAAGAQAVLGLDQQNAGVSDAAHAPHIRFYTAGTISKPSITSDGDLYIKGTVTSSATTITIQGANASAGANIPGGQILLTTGGTTGSASAGITFATTPSQAAGAGANAAVNRVSFTGLGSVVLNASGSALATTATDGFTSIPTCAGTPTGVPSATANPTGTSPLIVDSTNNLLYFYSTGAWRQAGVTPTLQTAYNGGQSIATTTALGAVTFTGTEANNNNIITLSKNPAGAQSGAGIAVTMGANASGIGLSAQANGSGAAVAGVSAGTSYAGFFRQAGAGLEAGYFWNEGANNSNSVTVLKNPVGSQSGAGIAVTMGGGGGATSGAGISVTMTTGEASGSALSVTGGTVTTNAPVLTANQTWNDAGVTFQGLLLSITNTNSGANSRLISLAVGGNSQFDVDTAGATYARKGVFTTTIATSSNAVLNANDGSYAGISSILYTGTNNATPNRMQSSSSAGVDFDTRLILYRTRGTMAAATSAADGDWAGGIGGQILGSDNSSTTVVGMVSFRVQGAVGAGTAGGGMVFMTTPAASGTLSERFAVNNSGGLTSVTGGYFGWTSSSTDPLTAATDSNLFRVGANIVGVGTTGVTTVDGQFRYRYTVSIKTSDYPVVANDTNVFFDNSGAGAQVNFTLPGAVAGMVYVFYVATAQNLVITAAGGDTIRFSSTVTAAAGNATSNTVGSCVRLVAIDTTQWVAESFVGSWVLT